MSPVLNLFTELSKSNSTNVIGFPVACLSEWDGHKLGISKEGNPLFFIKLYDKSEVPSSQTSLENIEITYSVTCELNDQGENKTGLFIIVMFNGQSELLREYFLEIMSLVIIKLPSPVSIKEAKVELSQLINLFVSLKQPSKKTIQGLWAELFVIERSRYPSILLRYWHCSSFDKFDFNNGIDKIEVKSTSDLSRRMHFFSLEQLLVFQTSKTFICSIVCIQSGSGVSVKDLIDKISSRLHNVSDRILLNQIVISVLGEQFFYCSELFYDYQTAVSTIRFVSSEWVPKIDLESLPIGVSNVTFVSDLSFVPDMNSKDFLDHTIVAECF